MILIYFIHELLNEMFQGLIHLHLGTQGLDHDYMSVRFAHKISRKFRALQTPAIPHFSLAGQGMKQGLKSL